jgi:hypothetical protein
MVARARSSKLRVPRGAGERTRGTVEPSAAVESENLRGTRTWSQADPARRTRSINPASPAGPGDSELPGRIRTDDLTAVAVTGTVNAVTGAVTAVTWGHDPALDVTGTVPAVIAVAGCQSLSRRADGPGLSPACHSAATRRLLAHATLACATEVAIVTCNTCRYARPSRYPLHRCWSPRWSRASRDPEVTSSFQNVPRPKRPLCRAEIATPPGSCPGGSQAIGQ